MSSVPKTTRRATTNGHGNAAPKLLKPWGDFLIAKGRDQTDREPVNGRGVALADAIRQAVDNVAGDYAVPGMTDPALVWEGGHLRAVVVGTPDGPRVVRFDWPDELAELDEAVAAYHDAREALRIDQRDQGGNHKPLREAMFDAQRTLVRLAFPAFTGTVRTDEDETPFEPFAIETARFVVQVEPYLHDLCCDDPPDYYIETLPVVVIPRPGLTAKGGAH